MLRRLMTKTEWGLQRCADNVSEKREYAFWLRRRWCPMFARRIDTWLAVNPVNSQTTSSNAIHILNRKASEQVKDSAGTSLHKPQYEYDSSGRIDASSAVQHDTAYSATTPCGGNFNCRPALA